MDLLSMALTGAAVGPMATCVVVQLVLLFALLAGVRLGRHQVAARV
jgi:hypothetical protein